MKVLYHASPHTNLSVIKPKHTLSKDKYIGDYVFATADHRLATMYLATKGVATLMNTDKGLWIAICCNEAKYLNQDRGGAIYELPADTFSETPQRGLSDYELVSKAPVKPINKTINKKSLDAMLDLGINIYFVDALTFEKLVADKNKRPKILSTLHPYRAK